jgi:two-component system, NtrC family, response regulator AtoC
MSSNEPAALVIVKDGPDDLVWETLAGLGYTIIAAASAEDALSRLQFREFDSCVVLFDMAYGLVFLNEVRRLRPEYPVIAISATASIAEVVDVMRAGAADLLIRPVSAEDLSRAVSRARASAGGTPRRNLPPPRAFVGTNPQMTALWSMLPGIASSDIPVLIRGETGVGKEVVARELHARSHRSARLFLKMNCAALPSELVESELFGYERGAFTGAFQKKAGMFEMADGGTLLLDEIGDMDVRLQAKLLQVLQDQEFWRLGGKEAVKVDVRILGATHRDLEKAIQERTFREDLYYRLNGISLRIPPLRERREDILPLAEFMIEKHVPHGSGVPTLTRELREVMPAYDWPGNVRELENFIRRLVVLRDPEILAEQLRAKTPREAGTAPPAAVPAASAVLDQVRQAKDQAETVAILTALNATHWNRKQAAALLKVDYKALLYKMKKLGVEEVQRVWNPRLAEDMEQIPKRV